MSSAPDIAVVIAAYCAQDTIAAAIRSALALDRVSEVVVVDDASSDATIEMAHAADDGSRRLRVFSLHANAGPAAARNVALQRSTAPLIAILDADDVFLPGRFDRLPADEEWDLFADNVVFVSGLAELVSIPDHAGEKGWTLSASQFVYGNISRIGAPRGELGFMKPVIRRAFLDANGIRYGEDLRLGEDFELYTRCLLAGGKFIVSTRIGYAAVLRSNSLSEAHGSEHLRALAEASQGLLERCNAAADRSALRTHRDHILAKLAQRELLDRKRSVGLLGAVVSMIGRPRQLKWAGERVLMDKLNARRGLRATTGPRTLLSLEGSSDHAEARLVSTDVTRDHSA